MQQEKYIHCYPKEAVTSERELFLFLTDCWLYATENKAIKLPNIAPEMFLWEKRQIYRKYILYYHCSTDGENERYYNKLEDNTYLSNKS